MRGIGIVALAAILCGATSALLAQERKPPSPLVAEVVAAWKKAGARTGWMGPGMDNGQTGGISFFENRPGSGSLWDAVAGPPSAEWKQYEVPAFAFSAWQLGAIGRLPQPESGFGLDLHSTQLTDVGLEELAGLKSLQILNLSNTKVTDAGLKQLAGLKSLKVLNLSFTKVTGDGLKELAGLKALKILDLANSQATDAGLEGVAELKPLQVLSLNQTKVTDAGLKELAGLEAKNIGLLVQNDRPRAEILPAHSG